MLEVEEHWLCAKDRGSDEHYTLDSVDVISATSLLEDGKPIPDKLVTMLLMELHMSGLESSSTTVEWVMSELVMNPEMMKRAQEELDAVVGPNRLVQESDILSLPHLQAIVKETFCVHPSAPLGVPRESIENTEVMGYKIPAWTRVLLNLFAIHRDPIVYKTPH